MRRIGLISDTHGLLRPEAVAFLQGCERILHAGDIGTPEVLEQLERVAPVTAVRGNNDREAWAPPESAVVTIGPVRILILHDLADLPRLRPAGDLHVVVSGHSHRPHVERGEGLLFVNPGSAGPRRFRLPIAAGELLLDGKDLQARTVVLI